MTLSLLLCTSILAALPPADGGWHYVRPAEGDAFEHPPLRALVTTSERPVDLSEKVTYRGHRRRYAQLRYGSPSSVRVAVVLDEAEAEGPDLYVDADRNRTIDARDKVEPSKDGRTWRLPLKLAPGSGEVGFSDEPRGGMFRLGTTGLTLSFAASGYLEGKVELAGRSIAARRVDGDGNGLLADPQDRLWLDLDGDGLWDPAAEQFYFGPILAIGDTRFAARSDAAGRRLDLTKLEGTGTVRLAPAKPLLAGSLVDVSALLVGRDGSAVSLKGPGEVVVPAGEYRMAATNFVVQDLAGTRWMFTFSDTGRRGGPTWHAVSKDAHLSIDPIGSLDLQAGVTSDEPVKPGQLVDLQPALYNGDGLRIVSVTRASAKAGDEPPTAGIALRGIDPGSLANARSGFE